jgi:hypothetical protein
MPQPEVALAQRIAGACPPPIGAYEPAISRTSVPYCEVLRSNRDVSTSKQPEIPGQSFWEEPSWRAGCGARAKRPRKVPTVKKDGSLFSVRDLHLVLSVGKQ